MSKTYIFEGNTTNSAIEKGLKELKVTKSQVDIKILDENKKSFFSILSPRVVKVEMTLKEEEEEEKKSEKREEVIISDEEMDKQIEVLKEFLDEFIEKLPTKEIQYIFEKENNSIKVIINGENLNYLIGYRAENMYSIQTILNAISNRKVKKGARIILDINGYKKKREEDLNNLAIRLAKKVTKTRKSITLEPMNAYERKIIHTRLQGDSKVETHSIGKEPYRKLVISLKK